MLGQNGTCVSTFKIFRYNSGNVCVYDCYTVHIIGRYLLGTLD